MNRSDNAFLWFGILIGFVVGMLLTYGLVSTAWEHEALARGWVVREYDPESNSGKFVEFRRDFNKINRARKQETK